MNLLKLTDKSLCTNADLIFSQQFGLPIEVYCSKNSETIAFGQIQDFNEDFIRICGKLYRRDTNLFFGIRHLSA
ncbi:hypothetical protein AJ85_13330 [Alkalihalobacillus alcalophilus ATCC 27647 = CGMCC 1.3604]|uniref:Uncharacterized protein n=1 Tax=Alkalihalobacillus alcalophilus ATCC 27647 = CGMCC 1.3604 TaxID=1218173 RepID=A0A094WSY9_ALKAL|nr:hypothetical protein [Alkalihalobacillus alcalophilus]KGA99183.1 hypothetical protein BALCAV_0200585 [Alkalihalobacillus alcalophilus ATCC 27647 = CGMCC 1.3604]MED1561275.1 hypothetical protein [Alkalihalobacillus alcalophilus]THG90097.1 hypothetical protein AJ85_13330 [Alkalihalobacillus alcalophilus ATCC 27647 = CGMCC 1.3604]